MNEERTFSLRAYPLCWPDGWKRTTSRQNGHFHRRETVYSTVGGSNTSWNRKKDLSVSEAIQRVLDSLERMGIGDYNVVISTNLALRLDGLPRSGQGNPADPGAAVYWRKSDKFPMKCIAIDLYTHVEDNLAAIAATLEAMRAIERHGGAEIMERTFQGFAALPAKASSTWREQMGFKSDELVSPTMVEDRFRELAQLHHPDKGGDAFKFREITEARAAARLELTQPKSA